MRTPRRDRRRGGSALELALLLPWYIFLFVGAFDWGYYAHALISTESAARVAALYTSQGTTTAADQTGACRLALEELRISPNVGSGLNTCSALPVIVTAVKAGPGQGVTSADDSQASQVAVTYRTVGLIPIPGLLAKQATFYRVVQMRLRS
jgi:Flp pilus assembly protein TadG